MFVTIILSALCIYYNTVFCHIYSGSSLAWFHGGAIGLWIDFFGVGIGIPLIKATVRILMRKFYFLKFLIIIDYSFFFLNYIL